jgi:hypothetical protein
MPSSVGSCLSQLGKSLAALLIVAPFAIGQTQAAQPVAAGGCGPAAVHFQIKTEKHAHPAVQPENGKALVYFIQDDTEFQSRPRPSTRFGLDGAWVGATNANSYFYVSVDPGEHRLCSSWQSFVGVTTGHTAAALSFKAEPGQTYYFLVRNSWISELQKPAELELKPVNDAEGELLASKFSLSTSHPK